MYYFFCKNDLGYILGDFFINSSDHPGRQRIGKWLLRMEILGATLPRRSMSEKRENFFS
jgi:hypothetical protein